MRAFIAVVLMFSILLLAHYCSAETEKELPGSSVTNNNADLQTRKSLRGFPGLDIPGDERFSFSINNKQEKRSIEVLMKLNGSLLTMETLHQYNKYMHRDEKSNLAEFRYYKSCALMGRIEPSYSMSDSNIVIVLSDAFETNLLYSFNLDKIEMSPQEKIDIMFDVMNKDIAELKDRLWFLDPFANKIGKGRNIESNDPAMTSFVEEKTTMYTGIYQSWSVSKAEKVFLIGDTFRYCLNGACDRFLNQILESQDSSSASKFENVPVVVRFPRPTIFRKIHLELNNGGNCPYGEGINFYVRVYYIKSSKPTKTYTYTNSNGYNNLWHSVDLNVLEGPARNATQKKLVDGFVRYEMETEQSVTDGIIIFISTNGLKSVHGSEFDGRCNYILRNIALI